MNSPLNGELQASAHTNWVFHAPEIECDGCAASIRKAVGAVPGVESVSVDVASKIVQVTTDGAVIPETIAEAMDNAGFTAEPRTGVA